MKNTQPPYITLLAIDAKCTICAKARQKCICPDGPTAKRYIVSSADTYPDGSPRITAVDDIPSEPKTSFISCIREYALALFRAAKNKRLSGVPRFVFTRAGYLQAGFLNRFLYTV